MCANPTQPILEQEEEERELEEVEDLLEYYLQRAANTQVRMRVMPWAALPPCWYATARCIWVGSCCADCAAECRHASGVVCGVLATVVYASFSTAERGGAAAGGRS